MLQPTTNNNNEEQSNDDLYVCMEIAAAESIPELNKKAPKANQ